MLNLLSQPRTMGSFAPRSSPMGGKLPALAFACALLCLADPSEECLLLQV